MTKRSLGQGLSSLLGAEALPKTGQEGLKEVYVSQLVPGKDQPRTVFDEAEIRALGQSIRENGVLQPILVRKIAEGSYEIVAGERRWRAAKAIGLDRLPALVREMSDKEAMTIALVENLQRENLNPLEEARGYYSLMEKMDITQEELSKITGKGRTHIANLCRLLQLPPKVLLHIEARRLSVGHSKMLVGLSEGEAEAVADAIVQKRLTVRQTERMIGALRRGVPVGESAASIQKKWKIANGVYVPPSKWKMIEKLPDGTYRFNRAGVDRNNMNLSPEELVEVLKIEDFISEKVGFFFYANMGAQEGIVTATFLLPSRESLDDFLAKINTITP